MSHHERLAKNINSIVRLMNKTGITRSASNELGQKVCGGINLLKITNELSKKNGMMVLRPPLFFNIHFNVHVSRSARSQELIYLPVVFPKSIAHRKGIKIIEKGNILV